MDVLLGNGNGTFGPGHQFGPGGMRSLAVDDVNGDGKPDVLIATDTVGVFLNTVPPAVLSIVRTSPPGPVTVDSSVSYTVKFNWPVTGVDASDFTLSLNGVNAVTPVVVTPISASEYTVTINGISGSGTLGLNLVNDGSIRGLDGQRLQPGNPTQLPVAQTFAGSAPYWGVLADVNGDGKPDLVVANDSFNYTIGTVSVLLGNGNGSFQPPQTFAAGYNVERVAVADFNGDGKPDIVVTNDTGSSGTVSILPGNGDGTFGPAISISIGGSPRGLVTPDLNGDGKADILVSVNNVIELLLGNANGTFQFERPLATGFNFVLADVNGDEKADLITPVDGGGVQVFLGNGNGTFGAGRIVDADGAATCVTVADINGDGRPDLVVGDTDVQSVSTLLGNGNGTFGARWTYAVFSYGPMAVADFSGDGNADVIVGGGNLMLGLGDGTLMSQGPLGSRVLAVADLNGDGKPDLIASSYQQIQIMINDSQPSPAPQLYTVAPPADTIAGTSASDSVTLTKDTDGTDVDWKMGPSSGQLPISDPNGLTIDGMGANDVITLDYATGNPLPKIVHLNGTFTIDGLQGDNPLANSNLEIGGSTVYIAYSASDPIAAIQGYLRSGYNSGSWNGTPNDSTGVFTSLAAAANSKQTTGIGYADSADGLIAGQPVNTIELKYALYGDTGLTGSVGFGEFTRLTQHYNQTFGGTWDTGDFNYDGSVNFTDFTLMTRTYNTTLSSQAAPSVSAAQSSTLTTSFTLSRSHLKKHRERKRNRITSDRIAVSHSKYKQNRGFRGLRG